jgi:hypothetical protein
MQLAIATLEIAEHFCDAAVPAVNKRPFSGNRLHTQSACKWVMAAPSRRRTMSALPLGMLETRLSPIGQSRAFSRMMLIDKSSFYQSYLSTIVIDYRIRNHRLDADCGRAIAEDGAGGGNQTHTPCGTGF